MIEDKIEEIKRFFHNDPAHPKDWTMFWVFIVGIVLAMTLFILFVTWADSMTFPQL